MLLRHQLWNRQLVSAKSFFHVAPVFCALFNEDQKVIVISEKVALPCVDTSSHCTCCHRKGFAKPFFYRVNAIYFFVGSHIHGTTKRGHSMIVDGRGEVFKD